MPSLLMTATDAAFPSSTSARTSGRPSGPRACSTTARAASVAYPWPQKPGGQAVEDLQPEALQRAQPGRADQIGPAQFVNEPQAVPGRGEIPLAVLDGFGDFGRGEHRAVEQEPPHIRRAPVSLQRGVIFRRHRVQYQACCDQDVVHGGHPTDCGTGASFRWIANLNR